MSNIEWTGDSWNPIVGCSIKSPGCKHCYAMSMAARLEAMGVPAYEGLTEPSKTGPVWNGKLEFSATMNDQTVLQAIRDKSASIPFAEGVMMRIELVYKEEFDGSVWRAIPKTRSVRRVLSPRITLPPGALFAKPD